MFYWLKTQHLFAIWVSFAMIRSDSPGLFLHDGAQHGGRGQQQRDPDQQREAVDDGTAKGFGPKDGHT